MPDAFIDSSVLIGLYFRHAGERAACEACLPAGGNRVSSQYIIFEIARGFLRSLLEIHNASFEYKRFSDFHMAAYSGARRFKPYQMATWLGAMTDFMAALEQQNVVIAEPQKLDLFRAMIRKMIQRGWKQLLNGCHLIDNISCQKNIPDPILNPDGRVTQALPLADCGKPNTCGVQSFIAQRNPMVQSLIQHLATLPKKQKGNDTDTKHIPGLQHLLGVALGAAFEGKKCHQCGDALICLEAPAGSIIATKNRGDFEPLAGFLSKTLSVATTATTTVGLSTGSTKRVSFPFRLWRSAVNWVKSRFGDKRVF
ncbi:MAG: hypothetical protein V4672_13190 [Verrucomicrobiota bacterium]